MSKYNNISDPKPADEQSISSIKKPNILPDAQPSETTTDDIDQPSLDILSQNVPKVSSKEAKDIINNMAVLSELDYQLIRVDTAKFLNVTLNSFDKLVKNAKNELGNKNAQSLVINIAPYKKPVDGVLIADQIFKTLGQYIACTILVKVTVVLWIFMTWVIPASNILPIAWINAPEKRCGKSTLLTLISRMSKRSLSTSNITGSALFRSIDSYRPTLCIDEIDTFINDNEGIRGILNAGHSRDNPYIIRCVGDDNEPTAFNVYGAKATSGIGKIPDTLIDRSIPLTLKRKLKNEKKEKVKEWPLEVSNTIQSQLSRWSNDNLQAIKDARPVLPVSINDRAQDNWEILLKIALVLGRGWVERAYEACIEISGIESDELSLNEQLLVDIQSVFNLNETDRLLSKHLLLELCKDPEMIWLTLNNGKPITLRQIAKRLSGFQISSKDMRTRDSRGNKVRGKGYDITDFQDAFSRYLS